ncbi:MAG: hypothetical protein HY764_03595 [Candidatus Portnoybacteria bacterium]|nr:hypothetical protein [Candidatus Portnoybacteria bacterium]
MPMIENPYNLISEILEGISNRRIQDVIRRRFGLVNGQTQTLQEIGEQYGITRERVRQIEENGLDYLSGLEIQSKIKPVQQQIHDYLKEHGELRREEKVFDDLVCLCFPKSQLEQMRQKGDINLDLCRSSLNLVLTLADPFVKIAEDDYFHSLWTIDKDSIKKAKKTVDSAIKYFEKQPKVLKENELPEVIKKIFPGISDKAILSYIDASKAINQNSFGDFGLAHWPEISPRGVKDKAYLVFKKENRPLHFSEVTELINKSLPQNKPAYVQTVHNELIKDPRFVLIGRGIYALSEWGYNPGTVVEVIKQVLKEKGPLLKEEILKNVLAKRLIKENTVLINLQNRKFFKRLEDGRFSIA